MWVGFLILGDTVVTGKHHLYCALLSGPLHCLRWGLWEVEGFSRGAVMNIPSRRACKCTNKSQQSLMGNQNSEHPLSPLQGDHFLKVHYLLRKVIRARPDLLVLSQGFEQWCSADFGARAAFVRRIAWTPGKAGSFWVSPPNTGDWWERGCTRRLWRMMARVEQRIWQGSCRLWGVITYMHQKFSWRHTACPRQ